MKRLCLFLIISLWAITSQAQRIITFDEYQAIEDEERKNSVQWLPYRTEGTDTILIKEFRPALARPPYVFKTKRQQQQYSKLLYNVRRVYPYSVLIRKVYAEIEDSLRHFTTDDARKVFIKKKEKELRDQFEDELIHLTISQGKILIKLVDRETGNTTYQVIQELKGGFSAFLWQGVARLFGSNLKSEYDADEEDRMIEDIIIRIENGLL
ncbi:MAG: DUF4294 domain-containing protein [Bacteroidales bacterium]|nr:DUF4294 domain-containing protein [Bacteroidales bacterium]